MQIINKCQINDCDNSTANQYCSLHTCSYIGCKYSAVLIPFNRYINKFNTCFFCLKPIYDWDKTKLLFLKFRKKLNDDMIHLIFVKLVSINKYCSNKCQHNIEHVKVDYLINYLR
jgi:hypothetical protein